MKNKALEFKTHIEPFLPTDEDIAFFHENGWYLSKPIFEETLIDQVYQATETFYSGKVDRHLSCEIAKEVNWRPGLNDNMRINDYIAYQNFFIRDFITSRIIGAIAARLVKCSEIRLFNSSLFSKPPHKPNNHTNWHTDATYLGNCTSEKLLTGWIPLNNISEQDSPLLMLSGSHKWDLTEADENFILKTMPYMAQPQICNNVSLPTGKKVNLNIQPIIMKKGQMSFHHMRTMHARCSNLSAYDIRALGVGLQDESNCYQPWPNNRENRLCKNFHDELCKKEKNGTPSFTDPAFCPLIWKSITD